MKAGAQLDFSFYPNYSVWDPTCRVMLPTFRVGLPLQLKYLENALETYTEGCFYRGSEWVMVTMKIVLVFLWL